MTDCSKTFASQQQITGLGQCQQKDGLRGYRPIEAAMWTMQQDTLGLEL
jgi:hypothetical protein